MFRKIAPCIGLLIAAPLMCVGRAAFAPAGEEAEPGEPVSTEQPWRKPLGVEQVEQKRKEIEARFEELARERAQKRLAELRSILEVTSDEKWARVSGNLDRLMTVQQSIAACRRFGTVAFRRAMLWPALPERLSPGRHPGLLYPGAEAEEKELRRMAEAQEELLTALQKKDAPEEAVRQALSHYRSAREEVEAHVRSLQAELSRELTGRQEAALVLLGMLE